MRLRLGFVANSSSSDWLYESAEEEEEEEGEEILNEECTTCENRDCAEKKRRVVAQGIFDKGSLGETIALLIESGMKNDEIASLLERDVLEGKGTEELVAIIRTLLEELD